MGNSQNTDELRLSFIKTRRFNSWIEIDYVPWRSKYNSVEAQSIWLKMNPNMITWQSLESVNFAVAARSTRKSLAGYWAADRERSSNQLPGRWRQFWERNQKRVKSRDLVFASSPVWIIVICGAFKIFFLNSEKSKNSTIGGYHWSIEFSDNQKPLGKVLRTPGNGSGAVFGAESARTLRRVCNHTLSKIVGNTPLFVVVSFNLLNYNMKQRWTFNLRTLHYLSPP